MKQNLGHILERIKSIYIYIYIGRRKAQLASSLSRTSSYNGLSSHIRFFRNFRILSLSASAALIAIMTLAVFPIIRKASTAEATSLPSTTTLTMTTGSESADLSLLVSNASGTFSSSSSDELAKFSIATNNYTGYTLTISGSDDDGLLTNTDTTITSNNTFSSIDTAISETTFDNSIYNGKWGYLPSKYSSVDNTSFRPAPTTTASTLNVTNCANDTTNCPDTEDDYTIGLGIRADYTKPAGTYTNTFILTATANPVGYSITYADNTGDSSVADIPGVQAGTTPATSVVLNPDKTPTRTGYTFRAWCDGTVSSNGTVCTGTEYTAGSSIDFVNQTIATSSTTLYAVWDANTYSLSITFAGTGVSSVEVRTAAGTGGTLMGTVSSSGGTVDNLVYNTAYYLYPTYTSGYELSSWAKTSSTGTLSSTSAANPTFTMGAGNGAVTITGKASLINYCTKNGVTDSNCMQKMTASNCSGTKTDARDGKTYTVATINSKCWMTKNLDLAGGTTLETTLSNVASTYTLPASSTSGFSDEATDYVYNSGRTNCSSPGCYSYYSHVAACAGQNPSTGNCSQDICPKGWRLPTQTEFTTLYNSYNTGAQLTASPFLGVYGGAYNHSKFNNGGSGGYYRSSTVDSSANAYSLYFRSDFAIVSSGGDMSGFSVRCVFDPPTIADFTNMQDVTEAAVANTAIGATATLKDTRDNQDYSVAKLGDGNLWMTRNLAIGCNGSGSTYGSGRTTRSLTSSDSNVSDTWSTSSAEAINSSNTSYPNGYTTAAMQCSSTYGAWYNYKAATAGTISGSSNSTNATKDICPSGWRLPTNSEQSGITSSVSAFSPVTGGYYNNGSLDATGRGFWWSATANNVTSRYRLLYNGSSLNTNYLNRYSGLYVRCIKS